MKNLSYSSRLLNIKYYNYKIIIVIVWDSNKMLEKVWVIIYGPSITDDSVFLSNFVIIG